MQYAIMSSVNRRRHSQKQTVLWEAKAIAALVGFHAKSLVALTISLECGRPNVAIQSVDPLGLICTVCATVARQQDCGALGRF